VIIAVVPRGDPRRPWRPAGSPTGPRRARGGRDRGTPARCGEPRTLSVADEPESAVSPAGAPGVLDDPAAEVVVIADRQHDVPALVSGSRGLHVGRVARPAVEVAVDIEADHERADRVQPVLLVGDAAESRVRRDPHGPAGPVAERRPHRRRLHGPAAAPAGRRVPVPAGAVARIAVDPGYAVEVGDGVALHPGQHLARVAALPAGDLVRLDVVAFGTRAPHAVLDPDHGLDERDRGVDPAVLARILIADLGDPGPAEPRAPVDRGRRAGWPAGLRARRARRPRHGARLRQRALVWCAHACAWQEHALPPGQRVSTATVTGSSPPVTGTDQVVQARWMTTGWLRAPAAS
jgi:hypothetical protein